MPRAVKLSFSLLRSFDVTLAGSTACAVSGARAVRRKQNSPILIFDHSKFLA